MPLLYDIATGLYHTGIRLAAPFVPKAKQWVDGRKGLWKRLEEHRGILHGCLWMHCASVGEFEQGRPVLEALKAQHPELPVLLTFFSPSGYEARKACSLATHVEYLPPDSAANGRRLLELVQPRAAIFVKYEFWYHHLHALLQQRVPTYLISAIFRKEQPFFRWYGGVHRTMLRSFTKLFVQDEASLDLLRKINIENVEATGDTRFDRVMAIVEANRTLPIAGGFKGGAPVLVCGSTWPADEALILASGGFPKSVIVPHEVTPDHLQAIEDRFPKPLVRWSELEGTTEENIADILGTEPRATLVVDRMGLLADLYKYADIAYIGGGFGDGIHSLLEAAAWGKPVLFGPRHHKFVEAKGLIRAGGGFEVRTSSELRALLERTQQDPEFLRNAAQAAKRYVEQHAGATQRTVALISPVLD